MNPENLDIYLISEENLGYLSHEGYATSHGLKWAGRIAQHVMEKEG
jgi:hypothetical protein